MTRRFTRDLDVDSQDLSSENAILRARIEALENVTADLEDFFENSSLGMHWVDNQGIIVRANRAELALLGYSRDDYIGRSITDFHVDTPVIKEILDRLSKGEVLQEFEARLRHQDGSIRTVLIDSNVRFDDGEFVHTRCFTRDITELREAQAAVDQRRRMDSLGALASVVAHDFNNLLVGMLGNAELLLDEPSDSVTDLAREIQASAIRAAQQCQQLLSYAKNRSTSYAPVDLVRLTDEAVQLCSRRFPKTVEWRREDVDPSVALAVEGQIHQVLMNLLTNAAESLPSEHGRISVRTGRTSADRQRCEQSRIPSGCRPGAYAFVEVEDQGSGIDEVTLDQMFDPFFSTKEQGNGIGLAGVASVVHAHNGLIEVDSKPGVGTTFRILLPVARLDTLTAPLGASSQPSRIADRWTLLLVDDDKLVLEVTRRLLQRHRLFEAQSGHEALRVLDQLESTLHAIVLDLRMPGMTSERCFHEIRNRLPNVPVLFISGNVQSESTADLMAYPGTGFLAKPFTGSDLRSALRKLMESSSAPRPAVQTS